MKTFKYIIPTAYGIALGVAIGVATKSFEVGIALAIAFSLGSKFKINKQKNGC